MHQSSPYILMIMADQLPARCLGAYGHPIIKTPHLDALAKRGVLFQSADWTRGSHHNLGTAVDQLRGMVSLFVAEFFGQFDALSHIRWGRVSSKNLQCVPPLIPLFCSPYGSYCLCWHGCR